MPGLLVVAGAAPEALAGLPRPDAVFIGGGVTVAGVIAACWDALDPGGRLVVNAVTVESEVAWRAGTVAWAARSPGSPCSGRPVGGFTGWRPAMPVIQWSVRKTPVEGSPAEKRTRRTQQTQENA